MSNTITQDITVSLNDVAPFERLYMHQYDSGRIVRAEIIGNDSAFFMPEDALIIFQASKSDGTKIMRDEGITHSGNVVTIPLTANVLAAAGVVKCEIIIKSAGEEYGDIKTLGTATFLINCTRSVVTLDEINSNSDYQTAVDAAVDAINAAKKSCACADRACDAATILEALTLHGIVVKYVVNTVAELDTVTPAADVGDWAALKGTNKISLYVYTKSKKWVYVTDVETSFYNDGFIFNEADLRYCAQSENIKNMIVMRDIPLTKDVTFKDRSFSLNGGSYTFYPSENYTGNGKFLTIGSDMDTADYNFNAENIHSISNLRIDCKHKAGFAFTTNIAWNLWLTNVKVINSRHGLVDYNELVDSAGKKVAHNNGGGTIFFNVSIRHSDKFEEKTVGFDSRFIDAQMYNVEVVGFDTGIRVTKGSVNFTGCTAWGFDQTGQDGNPPNPALRTRICWFFCGEPQVILNNCTADTCECVNASQAPSFENGGIGYYIQGHRITLQNCIYIAHSKNASKITSYFVTDRNPLNGDLNMSSFVNLNYCTIKYDSGMTQDDLAKIIYNPLQVEELGKNTFYPNVTGCTFGLDGVKSIQKPLQNGGNTICTENVTMLQKQDAFTGDGYNLFAQNQSVKGASGAAMRGGFLMRWFRGFDNVLYWYGQAPQTPTQFDSLAALKTYTEDKIIPLMASVGNNWLGDSVPTSFLKLATEYPAGSQNYITTYHIITFNVRNMTWYRPPTILDTTAIGCVAINYNK